MAGFQGNYVSPLGVQPLAGGSITSGVVASGSIGPFELASGAVRSGHIASGQVGPFHLASGSVRSGVIASGQVSTFHVASGGLLSGAIGSGQISINHLASGTAATALTSGSVITQAQFVIPFQSGTAWSLITEEIVSGVRAVLVSQSGGLRVAMASVSGRMPAIGIVADNVLSGIPANVYTQGMFQLASGLADYSGCLGKPVWVGRSGQIVQWSGSFNSGGLSVASGGDFIQRIGVVVTSGGFVANVVGDLKQTQLLGITGIIDLENRGFGV